MNIRMAAFLVSIALTLSAIGKPMLPPSLAEAVKCKSIVIAEYAGLAEPAERATFFGGISTIFKVLENLRGAPLSETVKVRYLFHDGTPCIAPTPWSLDAAKMPALGSKWILFLGETGKGAHETYRGNFGRMPASAENIEKVRRAIGSAK